jgi:hypothetical protein
MQLLAAAAGKIQRIGVELGKEAHDWILKPKRNDELLFTEFEGVDAVHHVPPGIYFAARSNARALTHASSIDTAAFNYYVRQGLRNPHNKDCIELSAADAAFGQRP